MEFARASRSTNGAQDGGRIRQKPALSRRQYKSAGRSELFPDKPAAPHARLPVGPTESRAKRWLHQERLALRHSCRAGANNGVFRLQLRESASVALLFGVAQEVRAHAVPDPRE